ncbi:DUF1848 family protein [candidate division KSB1 bacterium]|nr:DUF1848 family protein [candidate division KSB1 bacterium]
MIISASRRTDIPAFYSAWLKNRIEKGFCMVRNPFNPAQVRRVSLLAKDVDLFVFWTRNALPLLPFLKQLDRNGYHYYFLYTVTAYGEDLEPHLPSQQKQIDRVKILAEQIGSDKVIWRYDPILLSVKFNINFHTDHFAELAKNLKPWVYRVIVSPIDMYAKTRRNLQENAAILPVDFEERVNSGLFPQLAKIAGDNHLEIQSCASRIDTSSFGIPAGKCIDDSYIQQVFSIGVSRQKDRGQRKSCSCVKSTDIGRYNSCVHGCLYCYAVQTWKQAKTYFQNHNVAKPEM